jgi:hypothetical protein
MTVGGTLNCGKDYDNFCKWLESLHLHEDDVCHIMEIAWMGKLELENNARIFLQELKSE